MLRSPVAPTLGVETHVIWPWLMERAMFLLNRGEVGHDGKTAGTTGGLQGSAAGFAASCSWRRSCASGSMQEELSASSCACGARANPQDSQRGVGATAGELLPRELDGRRGPRAAQDQDPAVDEEAVNMHRSCELQMTGLG